MKKRDTERLHEYATEVFSHIKIYEIQGLLKEGDKFNCGIEAYQVEDFSLITFENFNEEEEMAKFNFCDQLEIPYYVIIASEKSSRYRVYNYTSTLTYNLISEYSEDEFIIWWREKQSFTQTKAMYNAAERIKNSMIDKLLFENSLAWGTNIDGFSFDADSTSINAIFEKRICTYKPPKYTINSYDPAKFFHGTHYRAGDFQSWNILFQLSKKLKSSLILLTFDTSLEENVGASKITNIDKELGIKYLNKIKPYNNIFKNNLIDLKKWLEINLT